jgi:tryptophanyl-tRNA synthetase
MIKVPGLDGSGKMGKSEGNAINLYEDPKDIRKKVMRAVTDSGPTEPNQPKTEPVENLFTLLKIVSTPDTVTHFEALYNNCEIRYGDLKKQLAEDIIAYTAPIRDRIIENLKNEAYLGKVAKLGAEKARESASKTLQEVKEVIGFKRLF